jgi:hypothetical protein
LPYTEATVLQEEVEDGERQQTEDEIIEPEHQQPLRWDRLSAAAREQRSGRPCGADDHRQQQRQTEQWDQQLARPRLRRQPRHQCRRDGDADVGEQEHEQQSRHGVAATWAQQQQVEGRYRDELDSDEEAAEGERLGDVDRGAVDRRQQQPVERAALGLGDEQAVGAQHRGEQHRHPQYAGGERAVDAVALEPEVEDDERGDAEQQHRRDRLAVAQLEPQLLAQQRVDGRTHQA